MEIQFSKPLPQVSNLGVQFYDGDSIQCRKQSYTKNKMLNTWNIAQSRMQRPDGKSDELPLLANDLVIQYNRTILLQGQIP